MELAEGKNTDDVVEAVTVDEVDENDILLDETKINQPQYQEQSSSSEVVPRKRKSKGKISSLFSDLYKTKKSKTVIAHDKLDLVKS